MTSIQVSSSHESVQSLVRRKRGGKGKNIDDRVRKRMRLLIRMRMRFIIRMRMRLIIRMRMRMKTRMRMALN